MKDSEQRRALRRYRGALVLVLIGLAAYAGILDAVYDHTLGGVFADSNQAFLDGSINRATKLLVPVGIVKGTVDVVEGSTVIGIEIGDVMQPLLEYINLAWRTLVASVVVLLATRAILPAATSVGGVFLVVALAAYAVWFAARATRFHTVPVEIVARKCGGLCLLVALFLYLALPFTVFTAGSLSRVATQPLESEYLPTFEQLGRIFAIDSVMEADGLKARAERLGDKANELISFVQGGGSARTAMAVFQVTTVYVLDAAVFPLACLVFLVWLFRRVLAPALGVTDEHNVTAQVGELRRLASALSPEPGATAPVS